jgi:hypothetical protein
VHNGAQFTRYTWSHSTGCRGQCSSKPSQRCAFKSHKDPRVIAARLRGGVSPRQPRAQPEKPLKVRCSTALWQGGSQLARTVKFEEQPDLQNSVQNDSHEATAPGPVATADASSCGAASAAAGTPGSSGSVSGSSAGSSTSAGDVSVEDVSVEDVSVEDVQQAFAELSPAYKSLTPSEKELVASALQTATAPPDNLPDVRAEALAVLQSAAAASAAASSAAIVSPMTEPKATDPTATRAANAGSSEEQQPVAETKTAGAAEGATADSTADDLSQSLEALHRRADVMCAELEAATWGEGFVWKSGLRAGLRALRSQCVMQCSKVPARVVDDLFGHRLSRKLSTAVS